jgi:[protein-PII] uridylyltransferase
VGLLHALTQAISEEDLQISAARITTEKGAALDTFTLEDREGNPVIGADHLARLLLRLKRVVTR